MFIFVFGSSYPTVEKELRRVLIILLSSVVIGDITSDSKEENPRFDSNDDSIFHLFCHLCIRSRWRDLGFFESPRTCRTSLLRDFSDRIGNRFLHLLVHCIDRYHVPLFAGLLESTAKKLDVTILCRKNPEIFEGHTCQ